MTRLAPFDSDRPEGCPDCGQWVCACEPDKPAEPVRRVEAGFYQVAGFDVVNLAGSSVRYPATMSRPWVVRRAGTARVLSSHDTYRKALEWARGQT